MPPHYLPSLANPSADAMRILVCGQVVVVRTPVLFIVDVVDRRALRVVVVVGADVVSSEVVVVVVGPAVIVRKVVAVALGERRKVGLGG